MSEESEGAMSIAARPRRDHWWDSDAFRVILGAVIALFGAVKLAHLPAVIFWVSHPLRTEGTPAWMWMWEAGTPWKTWLLIAYSGLISAAGIVGGVCVIRKVAWGMRVLAVAMMVRLARELIGLPGILLLALGVTSLHDYEDPRLQALRQMPEGTQQLAWWSGLVSEVFIIVCICLVLLWLRRVLRRLREASSVMDSPGVEKQPD
jgi:hypothetical protein